MAEEGASSRYDLREEEETEENQGHGRQEQEQEEQQSARELTYCMERPPPASPNPNAEIPLGLAKLENLLLALREDIHELASSWERRWQQHQEGTRNSSYYNNKAEPRSVVWNTIQSMVTVPSPVVGYGEEGLAVYYALQDYPVVNMTGFVIGSEWPWVEVLALRNGAAKVVTVEYQETKIVGTKKIEYIHPIEFAKQWSEKNASYDFSISFSSIEHSGLGRYGDPIDPFGDLKEVQKVLCLLKRGGSRLLC
ncbi:unnamed protein product [Cylicocyclus nassatus]|uniref:Uncharacterized protein n=1 Tax=Cylicocyclus nassatus TaxID=53992 RepID=A0AA36H9Y1_CYLNA|nr:unnamed protein product [Cylicocyclus nassatus]